jgi:uncharacterized membrane protein
MRRDDQGLWLWLVLGVLVLLTFAGAGLRGVPWYGPHPFGGWLWGTGWLFAPVLWAGLIGLVILLCQRDRAPTHADPQRARPAALEYLAWRFAAGELTREQYDEMRRMLESEHAST